MLRYIERASKVAPLCITKLPLKFSPFTQTENLSGLLNFTRPVFPIFQTHLAELTQTSCEPTSNPVRSHKEFIQFRRQRPTKEVFNLVLNWFSLRSGVLTVNKYLSGPSFPRSTNISACVVVRRTSVWNV